MRIQLIKNEIKEDFPDLCKIVDQCEKHSPVVYFLSIPIYKESLMCTKLEDQWAEPVSLTFHSVLIKHYTEPSIGARASYQTSVHLATRFQRFFRNNQKKELPMVAMFVNRSG